MDKYPEMSPAEALATQFSAEDRAAWLGSFTKDEQQALEYEWEFWARPKQRMPKGDWRVAMFLAGRGFGKTRTCAEIVRQWVESGEKKHIALIAGNDKDLRDTVVESQRKQGSGLMQICPPWNMPHYSPTYKTLTWNNPNYPSYGAVCSLYSAEEPDQLRGPSHDAAWVDEWAKHKRGAEVWDMLRMTMRIGKKPQTIISTTPKPVPFLIDFLESAMRLQQEGSEEIIVIKGSTFENRANLAKEFMQDMLNDYEGTSLGRQELYADLILGAEGALWSAGMINKARVIEPPSLGKIIIAVDPQMGYGTSEDDDDGTKQQLIRRPTAIQQRKKGMTGIIAAGSSMPVRGYPPHAYILDDCSISGKPETWGKAVIDAFYNWDADYVIAEGNQGGQMIASVLRSIDPNVPVKIVTALKKKHERAIPVVTKYEQARVHHVGIFQELESEMIMYIPGDEDKKMSPNRMDAMVWAVRHLLVDSMRAGVGISIGRRI